ncbi:MAG: UbiD family decarboxylase [Chloroflexota bacterium]
MLDLLKQATEEAAIVPSPAKGMSANGTSPNGTSPTGASATSRDLSTPAPACVAGRRTDQLNDLHNLLAYLDEEGDLHRVRREIDPHLELAGYASKLEGGPVILFEKLRDSEWQAAIGLLWSRQVLGRVFDVPPERLPFHIADAIAAWRASPIPPVVVDRGPANHVIEQEVDLSRLPVPVHALKDGGAYLDCSAVIARDPMTGVRNVSIQRCLVTGKDRLTMLIDRGRDLRAYWERARWQGRSLPITINNGVGLAVYVAAAVPSKDAPIFTDELGVASQLLGQPLRLLRSQTSEVEGVADAQFILEGEILPDTFEPEGPFAEVTGYYASRDNRWVVKVNKITRRRKPIFHTLLSGKEVFNSVGLLGEAAVFRAVGAEVPSVTAVHFTHGGCGFYGAVVQMRKGGNDEPERAIRATFRAFPPLKMATVVDDDVDIFNASDVEWAMATRWRPETGLITIPNALGHELNPSLEDGRGTKVGFDATAPYPRDERFERISYQDVPLS